MAVKGETTSGPVTLEGVYLENREETVLADVSLEIPERSFTLVMGPSGSGKSVLLKVAGGLIPPTRGVVEILGSRVIGLSYREEMAFRRRTGFDFQDSALWQNMTLFQNLALPLRYHEPGLQEFQIKRRVYEMVEPYGLASAQNSRPSELSAGERKIASFLRSLVLAPELLFLDEPITSVDYQAGRQMIATIRRLKGEGRTIMAVSHNPQLASQLADHLIILKEGRVLTFDRFERVVRSKDPEVAAILSDVLSQTATYDGDLLSLLDDAPWDDPGGA